MWEMMELSFVHNTPARMVFWDEAEIAKLYPYLRKTGALSMKGVAPPELLNTVTTKKYQNKDIMRL